MIIKLALKNVVFWDVSRVVRVKSDVSEECIASIIKITRIRKL
jgi:hypothetical protein